MLNDYADTPEIILITKNKKEIVTQKVIWYFQKLRVRVVIDYVDTVLA